MRGIFSGRGIHRHTQRSQTIETKNEQNITRETLTSLLYFVYMGTKPSSSFSTPSLPVLFKINHGRSVPSPFSRSRGLCRGERERWGFECSGGRRSPRQQLSPSLIHSPSRLLIPPSLPSSSSVESSSSSFFPPPPRLRILSPWLKGTHSQVPGILYSIYDPPPAVYSSCRPWCSRKFL